VKLNKNSSRNPRIQIHRKSNFPLKGMSRLRKKKKGKNKPEIKNRKKKNHKLKSKKKIGRKETKPNQNKATYKLD